MENESNSLLENDLYSTEYRFFDPRLARWMSLDPLMDQFPWMSPFVGMDNNPISLTDPLGLKAEGGGETYVDKDGKKQKSNFDAVTVAAKKPSWLRIRISKMKRVSIKIGNELISSAKNASVKIKGGLMLWADGPGGNSKNERTNPAGSLDVGKLLKMFDLFGLMTKSKGENELSGEFNGEKATEKSNDTKELVEYNPKEIDDDFEAINKKKVYTNKENKTKFSFFIIRHNHNGFTTSIEKKLTKEFVYKHYGKQIQKISSKAYKIDVYE